MMKAPILAALLLLSASSTQAVPKISGIFVLADSAHFQLVDGETSSSSPWIKLGGEFDGYTLSRFDTASNTLILTRDGKSYEVGLATAVIVEATVALSGTISLGAGTDLDVRYALLVFGHESSFPLAPGVTLFLKPTKRSNGNVQYTARWEMTTDDGHTEVIAAPRVTTRPGEKFRVQVGDLGFELKP